MMTRYPRRFRRLHSILLALGVLLTAMTMLPAADANAQPQPTWQAWGVEADFSGGTYKVFYTAYVGTNNPTPQVLNSRTYDITTRCTLVGNLSYDGDYAVFNGQTHLDCVLPSWRNQLQLMAPGLPGANQPRIYCTCGGAPFFVGADVKITQSTGPNPLMHAPELGMAFSTPVTNGRARSYLQLDTSSYLSSPWNIDLLNGNQTMMGMNGPAIVEVADHFDWLTFLTAPNWENYFSTKVVGAKLGYWSEDPIAARLFPGVAYSLRTKAAHLYIGFDPLNNVHFVGKARKLEGDPGCFTG